MKKLQCIFILLLTLCTSSKTYSQTIEIHQIDVGTGDATLINIKDNMHVIQHSILIDAGETYMYDDVIKYLKDHAKKNGTYIHLDYIITSHYHSDHIGGMVGSKKRKRKLGKNSVNGYNGVLADTSQIKYFAVLDKGSSVPSATTELYKKYKTLAGDRRITVGANTIGSFSAIDSITPSPNFPPPFPDTTQQLSLGGYINLGQDSNAVPIRLRLVVADAKVYYPGKPTNTYNVADSLGIRRAYTGNSTRKNPNNWGIGWVLEYGAFRYYTAGDIGGYDASYGTCNSCGSNYFDLETPMSKAFKVIYPQPASSPGHICTQKISHHGSCCSTNPIFWGTLRPSLAVISAGHVASFGHPTQEVFNRIETATWAADSLRFNSLRYYLMTELNFDNRNINLNKGATSGSISWVATTQTVNSADTARTKLMDNGSRLYFMNSTVTQVLGDVIIKVYESDGGVPISQQSRFQAEIEKYNGAIPNLSQNFNCHGE